LKRIQQEVGITFIYVTHDQDEALTMSDRIAVMDGGRILQIGPPNDVYDDPRSQFVAGFVGVSNVLELEVESVENGRAKLRLGPRDDITAIVDDGVRPGATAIVTIRPERIALDQVSEGVAATDCRASGRVRESLYAGPTTRFVVDLDGGGELVVVRQNAQTSFADAEELRGQPVTLRWASEFTRVIGTNDKGGSK